LHRNPAANGFTRAESIGDAVEELQYWVMAAGSRRVCPIDDNVFAA
jgi:hypothetical protein